MMIEEIVRQKPHLADLFRFYEKTVVFNNAARTVLTENKKLLSPEMKAYPGHLIEPLFKHFAAATELPEDMLAPLKLAMEVGDIDLTRLPLREVPAFSLPYAEDDLAMLLYLLARPYFSWLRDVCRLDGRPREGGRCPLCNGQPTMLSVGTVGQQRVHCSYCGTTGSFEAGGCPVCGDAAKLGMLSFDGERGFRVTTCDTCRSYVKTVESAVLKNTSPDIADLMSLPIDFVVQEKGYVRRAPNPLGMIRMFLPR